MKTLQEQAGAMLETIDTSTSEKKEVRAPHAGRSRADHQVDGKGEPHAGGDREGGCCDKSTVCRVLQLVDTRKEARMILESGAAKMAHTVVNTKNSSDALKGLQSIDVVPRETHGGGHSGVQIIIGMPGHPVDLPDIEASFRPQLPPDPDAA